MTSVRFATLDDVESIVELEDELFPENNLGSYSLQKEFDRCLCWVVEKDGDIVAYLLAAPIGEELIDILRVGVHPTYQGQGLGTSLIYEATKASTTVMLTVRKANVRAIRLYRRLGFDVCGERRDGIHPAWMMRRLTSDVNRTNDRSDTL